MLCGVHLGMMLVVYDAAAAKMHGLHRTNKLSLVSSLKSRLLSCCRNVHNQHQPENHQINVASAHVTHRSPCLVLQLQLPLSICCPLFLLFTQQLPQAFHQNSILLAVVCVTVLAVRVHEGAGLLAMTLIMQRGPLVL